MTGLGTQLLGAGALLLLAISAHASLLEMRDAPALPIFPQQPRDGKSLVNTFPFNTRNNAQSGHHSGAHHHADHDDHHAHHDDHHDHPHDHHHGHHADHSADSRLSRQDDGSAGNELDIGTIATAGERCVEKVMMVEETQYDEQIECHHSYDQRCHTTYSTDFQPQQVEECDENYRKNCYIEYKNIAIDEQVEICNDKLVKNCNLEAPTVCETVYESQCETSYHEHVVEEQIPDCKMVMEEKCEDVTVGYTTEQKCDSWPKQVCELKTETNSKYTPETECQKVPREVCGPGPCPLEQGPKECRTETKTIIQEAPEEKCELTPEKICKHITKMVPVLVPKRNCVDVPKEVCSRARRNPRKVNRPVIKKWCYVPTEESGLLREAKSADSISDDDSALLVEAPIDAPIDVAATAKEAVASPAVVAKIVDDKPAETPLEAGAE